MMNEHSLIAEDMISSYLAERTQNNSPFFDELVASDGTIFPHWQKLVESYNRLGNEKMNQREREVAHQLRENGVTYNVYGDPNGMNRPWILDPVPMVFSEENWQIIEKGLIQRTTLLNHLLSDIYGSRELIRSGHIPFELIYNHKGFLRQMDKVKIPGEQQLIHYSADLARGPNGKMWVLHDRVDAPSGAGYTFENRVAMTRVFPEIIRENRIRKITTYYQTLKNTLVDLAWQNKEDPRIVFLTPGTGNETYFEHAYLSSFMGFTLVTGADLTVSDGYVWLKTIKGLEKVDVIVRRVDDIFCDPLEFQMESHLGVVGLMESVRQNKVMIINPLGCRVLENPGLMAFLPKLCQHILGEDLILPSVATWWCGQDKEKEYVLDNVHMLIIRKIYRNNTNRSIYGPNLTEQQITELKDEINTRPYLYVAQEMVNFSTTPSYINGKLEARNAVFRSYVVANSIDKSYYVMPGGMSRSSAKAGVFIVSNQSGGISKDTWVLGQSTRSSVDLSTTIIKQTDSVLPSRTAENLFWLGRYVERSIFLVRLLRIILKKYNETEDNLHPERDTILTTFLKALSNITLTLPGFTDKKILQNPEKELISVITDTQRIGSFNHSLQSFLRNGYSVRDRLGLDIWRILDSISEEGNSLKNNNQLNAINYSMDNMIVKLMAFHGLSVDTMTREPSWNMLSIGRYVESSTKTCAILRHILAQQHESDTEKSLLEYVLINNESLITYRYKYRSTLEISSVLTLLLINELNPRSVAYQIAQIDKQAERLPMTTNQYLDPIRKKLLEATTMVRLCDPKVLAQSDEKTGQRKELIHFLDKVTQLLSEVSGMIINQYFNHTESQYGFVTTKIPEI